MLSSFCESTGKLQICQHSVHIELCVSEAHLPFLEGRIFPLSPENRHNKDGQPLLITWLQNDAFFMSIDLGARCLENCLKCLLGRKDKPQQIQTSFSSFLNPQFYIFSSSQPLLPISLRNRSNRKRTSADPTAGTTITNRHLHPYCPPAFLFLL